MRVFIAIMGLLFLLALGSQAVRHNYWRWVAAYESALEPFKEPTEQKIAQSKSLEELVQLYKEAHEAAEKARQNEPDKSQNEYERREREPYKSEESLENAIEIWEQHERQIFEVQFLWWCGAIAGGIGAFVIRRADWWLGLSLLILGFMEMTYATAPPFSLGGSNSEFVRLLTYKANYSIAAVGMLLLAWWYIAQLLPARFPARPRPQ